MEENYNPFCFVLMVSGMPRWCLIFLLLLAVSIRAQNVTAEEGAKLELKMNQPELVTEKPGTETDVLEPNADKLESRTNASEVKTEESESRTNVSEAKTQESESTTVKSEQVTGESEKTTDKPDLVTPSPEEVQAEPKGTAEAATVGPSTDATVAAVKESTVVYVDEMTAVKHFNQTTNQAIMAAGQEAAKVVAAYYDQLELVLPQKTKQELDEIAKDGTISPEKKYVKFHDIFNELPDEIKEKLPLPPLYQKLPDAIKAKIKATFMKRTSFAEKQQQLEEIYKSLTEEEKKMAPEWTAWRTNIQKTSRTS